jgi:hypothetical protein
MEVLNDELTDKNASAAHDVDSMFAAEKTSDELMGTQMQNSNLELDKNDCFCTSSAETQSAGEQLVRNVQSDYQNLFEDGAQSTAIEETFNSCDAKERHTVNSSEIICHSESVTRNAVENVENCLDLCSNSQCTLDCANTVLLDLINQVVDLCEERSCSVTETVELTAGEAQTASEVEALQAMEAGSQNLTNQAPMASSDQDEMQQTLNCELRLSLPSMQRCGQAFQVNSYTPHVVIDLRHPPLVQVCTLYGTTDNGSDVGCSGANSFHATAESRRPQTAIRGRRRLSGFGSRQSHIAVGNDIKDSTTHSLEENFPNRALTEADGEKTVAGGMLTRRSLRNNAGKVGDIRNGSESKPNHLRSTKKIRRASIESIDSDEDCMTVQTVNRTYARYSYTPHAPVIVPDDEAESDVLFSQPVAVDRPKSRLDSVSSGKIAKMSVSGSGTPKGLSRAVEKNQRRMKRRARVGPAWYSRLFLNSPPAHLLHHGRTVLWHRAVRRPNYSGGCRHHPLPRNGGLSLKTRQQVYVKPKEISELENVGGERLVLWRMSSDDLEELQSQLMREAEHRRVEHAMPVVMQLSSDQIETAYQRVAESMNTFDIVAADSDEDEIEQEEEEALEEDNYKEILDEYRRMIAEREQQDEQEMSTGTEYTRSRPKRLAVDYGPSAFAPILLMEGRRLSSEKAKFAGSGTKPAAVLKKSNQADDDRASDAEVHTKKKHSDKSPGLSKEMQRNVGRRSNADDRVMTNGKR